jgi:hypothetical protein
MAEVDIRLQITHPPGSGYEGNTNYELPDY